MTILVGWSIPIVLRFGQLRSLVITRGSTDINPKTFIVFHIGRELLRTGGVVLCDGGKAVLIALRAAVGERCGRSHCHPGLLVRRSEVAGW
jgi:hypothetical protein